MGYIEPLCGPIYGGLVMKVGLQFDYLTPEILRAYLGEPRPARALFPKH